MVHFQFVEVRVHTHIYPLRPSDRQRGRPSDCLLRRSPLGLLGTSGRSPRASGSLSKTEVEQTEGVAWNMDEHGMDARCFIEKPGETSRRE